MKRRVYIQIAKGSNVMKISSKSHNKPICSPYPYNKKYYPSVEIALNLDIPDKYFDSSKAEIDLKLSEAKPLSEIKVEEVGEK